MYNSETPVIVYHGSTVNDNALFFTCSLIEYIGRLTKNKRKDIIDYLGEDVNRIYKYADVFHCEPIEKVADDFILRAKIPVGNYDVAEKAKYSVPDYWDIGEVFARLVEDLFDDDTVITGIKTIFQSWLTERILNFNSDLYYQPRDYLAECYREGTLNHQIPKPSCRSDSDKI